MNTSEIIREANDKAMETFTNNTQAIIDENGIINVDIDEQDHLDYSQECDLELMYDDVEQYKKEFGYGSPQHIKARLNLTRKWEEFRLKNLGITPRIFFTHVKSSLQPIENIKVQERMRNIKKLAEYCGLTGQEGARNQYLKLIVGCMKESEINAAGFNYWLKEDAIKDYMRFVRENPKEVLTNKNPKKKMKKIIYFEKLRDFPRVIPKDVQTKMKDLKAKKIFDDYKILYLDYVAATDKTESSTTKREKDPVLFGTIKELPERLYFIHAWEDEYCDLSVEGLVERSAEGDFDFIADAGEVTAKYLKTIKRELAEHEASSNRFTHVQRKGLITKIKSWIQ